MTAGKATFAATVPTSNGTATAVYRDQGCGNNDTISASVDGISGSVGATIAIAAPTAASVQFKSATPTDKSIVIKGQGGNGRVETATLTFKVFDTFGNALAGRRVDFSVTAGVTLNKAFDNTDANGEVITTVNSQTTPTSFKVKADIGGGISTQSDSIVVTTGVAVQRAFSLSVGSPNVEGWGIDSGTVTPATTVGILLADQAGNPVPDGAPVVFQTNMGAVGSSSKGACTTVNGGCTVDFRTQNPRVATPNSPVTPCNTGNAASIADSQRPGLATVCASTTDGVTTLFGKTTIFFSDGVARYVYLNGSSTPLSGASVDLGIVGKTASKVFTLQINDLNFNPLPAGTKVEITNITSASAGGVSPATVPNVFAHYAGGDDPSGNNISGNQGSTHTITIGSTLATDCTADNLASFNVSITSPHLLTTVYPFTLTFQCK